jgi:indoleamine 2,3-dioxygenase
MSFLSQTTPTSSSSLTGIPEVDALLQDLPRINALGTIKTVVDGLPDFDPDELSEGPATAKAFMAFGFLAHSYIWSDPAGGSVIPRKIAPPWVTLAARCGLPPVLTYSSYVLDNHDGSGAQDPAPLLSFTGGVDEFWFIRVHQRIELAGAAVRTLADADAPSGSTSSGLVAKLAAIANALEAMCDAARRMEEGCDPYIYYHRLRRFLFAWKWNPVFGNRSMRYEGVRTEDLPLGGQYSGESGSQSPLLPLVDRLLGIDHQEPFRSYTAAMREYMYPDHRLLVANAPSLYIDLRSNGSAEAVQEYERALEGLVDFRSIHLQFAKRYIVEQTPNDGSANDLGTGGSAALSVLASARATVEERLKDPAI